MMIVEVIAHRNTLCSIGSINYSKNYRREIHRVKMMLRMKIRKFIPMILLTMKISYPATMTVLITSQCWMKGKVWNDIQYDAVDEDVEVESEHLQSKPSKLTNKVTVITFLS